MVARCETSPLPKRTRPPISIKQQKHKNWQIANFLFNGQQAPPGFLRAEHLPFNVNSKTHHNPKKLKYFPPFQLNAFTRPTKAFSLTSKRNDVVHRPFGPSTRPFGPSTRLPPHHQPHLFASPSLPVRPVRYHVLLKLRPSRPLVSGIRRT